MRRGAGFAVLMTLTVVAVVAYVVSRQHSAADSAGGAGTGPYCSATVDGRFVELSVEQAENAALIASTAVRRGLPARAVSIALATAYQESDLYNLDYGDRDSAGLFQQRPSQGWGTPAQVRDPAYATNAFYDALLRVPDYTTLEITVAAQEVQRSGFPSAYADHEPDARVLASALTGYSPAAFTCHLPGKPVVGSEKQLRREARTVFGASARRVAPSGVAVRVGGRTTGWAVAQYFVAQAAPLGISQVAFDGRTWTRGGAWTATADAGSRAVVLLPAR